MILESEIPEDFSFIHKPYIKCLLKSKNCHGKGTTGDLLEDTNGKNMLYVDGSYWTFQRPKNYKFKEKKNVKNEVLKWQDSYLPSWNQSLHHISVHWLNLWTKIILDHRNDTSWLRLDSLK